MHKEILSKEQTNLLPLLREFSDEFGLAGGTAIALQIGHRKSIDFDLFSNEKFDNGEIRQRILKYGKIDHILVDKDGEFTAVVDGVRVTFLFYPFEIDFSQEMDGVARLADLKTLAALKAYALGRRAKWKDYVDLFFILQNYSMQEIIDTAKNIFKDEFNEKIFRSQLAYFEDIDHSEKIDYMEGFEVEAGKIEEKLKELSVEEID